MTQAALAKKLGITPQNISQYERNVKSPKIETLKKIADALNVFITDLTGDVSAVKFESNAERRAYRVNQKINSTGARIFGEYIDGLYCMWIVFADKKSSVIDENTLIELESQFDRFAEFSVNEFRRLHCLQEWQEPSSGAYMPGYPQKDKTP